MHTSSVCYEEMSTRVVGSGTGTTTNLQFRMLLCQIHSPDIHMSSISNPTTLLNTHLTFSMYNVKHSL